MRYTDAPLIELDGLTKGFGNNEVLKGLDLALPPGIHALLGPNGAGKTTLVNILSTLTPFDSGAARVLGLDVRGDKKKIQGMISLTGQYAAVDERLSGVENLHMMGRLFGLSRRDTADRTADLLDRFELTAAAGKRVSTYSGGMRRKLDIAVSLIARPRLIFLDEPTTGLDTRSRQTLWDEITGLAQTGTSIFLTTQYLEEADVLADRILVLNDGRIVADGTASQLKERVGGSTIQLHDGHGNVTGEIATRGSALEISRHLAALAAERPDVQVTVRRPTLDEVFLQLTGKKAA
ncbi:ATP-binding cassette domain-containing protein [Actinomadura sp. 7K507]|uniref:ATP-binding cassette domain-containing protein n=1 Tax=Actinomadura sp. 7K507 TaxID=2530365 RepID=UPI0010449F59|nr:ATP-binding cassette domain-containing protein [Actinomadura sp. 7K507]TDC89832.1 ATP-binding cassette domain-containing protein [Actinomadura sp. 7K507]